MNRIIAINLCGIVFQIDESAYETLKKYLNEIKINLGNSAASTEIYQDMENRIAELFQHKINDGVQAILPKDVDEVIALMGNAEQFKEFNESNQQQNTPPQNPYYTSANQFRRIYRNPNDKVLGGVCSGLAAYFGVDPIIIRLVFVALFFAFGITFFIYIICWIAIPKANTAPEMMAMMGKPFTFDDIKRNVRTEAEDVKNNFDRMRQDFQSRNYNGFTDVLRIIFKVIAFAFLILGLLILIPVAFAIIIAFISAGFAIPFAANSFFDSSSHSTLVLMSIFFIVFIPLFAVIYKLIRAIFHSKPMNNWLTSGITVAWFGCIVYLMFAGREFSKDFKNEKTVKQEIIIKNKNHNTFYINAQQLVWKKHQNKHHVHIDISGIHWGNGRVDIDTLMNANVSLNVKQSVDSLIHLVIEKSANGSSDEIAAQRANEIVYLPIQNDSSLTLPHYFKKLRKQLWRNQQVNLELQIPFNKPVHFSKEALDLIDEKFFQAQYQDWDDDKIVQYNWVMTSNGLREAK